MREVRISLVPVYASERPAGEVLPARAREYIAGVSRDRPDLILLPELFANHATEETVAAARAAAQTVPGPLSEELAALARRHKTYIAFGLLRRAGERLYNSLVLLDREGRCVWTYDKVAPVDWEMDKCGVTPGGPPQAYDTDFGRIGAAICFDINYNELAETWFRQDIELLLFSSAFPGGRLLDAWAVRFGFAVAGCTWLPANRVIDCTGATVGRTSALLPYTTTILNLNRRVVHMDYNLEKIDRLRTKYAGDVLVEDLRDEACCVITSLKPGLEVKDLIREFDITPLSAYFDHSRQVRERHGGLPWRSSGI